MSKYRRFAVVAVSIVAAFVAAAGVAATPAQASIGHNVGVNGYRSTCNGQAVCFYWYGDLTGAYWGTHAGCGCGQVADLNSVTFWAGTGDGAGYVVRNNAAAIACTTDPYSGCSSFYNTNYNGNWDYLLWGQIGTLYFTWNDEASVKWY